MRHLFALLAFFMCVSFTLTSESNGTFGETIDGVGLLKLGRKLHKPMLTLIGMAIKNLHPCEEWTPWSPCTASRRGYFGTQTRTRSCNELDVSDVNNKADESDKRLCEGFCPVSYNRTNYGVCMKLNTTFVSYDEATKQCHLEGGYLMNIDTQQKVDGVKPLVQGFSTYPHIDGRRKDATSPWQYIYGSPSAFLKWHIGYPQKELCLVLHVSKLTQYDYSCSYKRPFICEVIN